MSLALVQQNPSGGNMDRGTSAGSLSNYTMASAFASTPAPNSLIVVCVCGQTDGGTAAVTVTDAAGTYTNAVTVYDSSGGRYLCIAYRVATTGSVQPNAAVAYGIEYDMVAYNYSGNETSAVGDGTGTLNPTAHMGNTGTDTVSMSGATTNAPDLLVSLVCARSNVATGAIALPSGWDQIDQHQSDGTYSNSIAAAAVRVVTSTGSYSCAFVGSGDGNPFAGYGAGLIAAFKGTAAGGGLVVNIFNGRGGGAAMPFAK